jgi:predicted phage tail component-like protein
VQQLISFNFKNNSGIEYNSLDDFGIYLSERPALPRPNRKFRYTEVEGRKNGALTEDLNTYDDIEIKLSCFMLNTDISNNILDNLNIWLNGEGGILTFSFLFDKYYKVKEVKGYQIKESSGILGEFEISFLCEPFRYLNNGQDNVTIISPTTIYNQGTYKSKPELKIYGSGNVVITINNEAFIINNLDEYIIVDTELMDCYKNTQFLNDNMIGNFPEFEIGENTISWSGNINKIEINGRWCFL